MGNVKFMKHRFVDHWIVYIYNGTLSNPGRRFQRYSIETISSH